MTLPQILVDLMKPFMPLVASGLASLSVSGIWKLIQAMVG